MKDIDLNDFRQDYGETVLNEPDLPANPIDLFEKWLNDAIRNQLPEPNAMTLATVTPRGKPSARIVLLKEIIDGWFVFYTNYSSRKGIELAANPYGALVFSWLPLYRQVRLSGAVNKVPPEISDRYFVSRPRNSRVATLASQQSNPIASRQELEEKYNSLVRQYRNRVIHRPPYWGGYQLHPREIEFWQGCHSRLHDRIVYTLQRGKWSMQRLAP